jgi:DNA-binding NarL/FixJ family response regulator
MHPTSKTSIGVLIADDSAAFCKLIVHLLQREPSVHITGVAGNLEDALNLAVEYTPDVLLLDLHLQGIAAHDPLSIKIGFLSCVRHIIAMSTKTDGQERQIAQSYGAAYVADKFWLSEQLVPVIRACALAKRPLTQLRRQQPSLNRFAS